MNFGDAIQAMKYGRRVTRGGWNGKDMWLKLKKPEADAQKLLGESEMTVPFIYMCTVQGDLVPWLASQTDILAEDWAKIPPGHAASEVV